MIAEILKRAYEAAAILAPPGVEPLPFFLTALAIFAIAFTALERIEFLEKNKGARFVIAAALAYFAAASGFVSIFVAKFFPAFGLVIAAVVLLLIALFLVAGKELRKEMERASWMLLIGIVGFGVALLLAWPHIAQQVKAEVAFKLSPTDIGLLALIIGFVVFLLWIMR